MYTLSPSLFEFWNFMLGNVDHYYSCTLFFGQNLTEPMFVCKWSVKNIIEKIVLTQNGISFSTEIRKWPIPVPTIIYLLTVRGHHICNDLSFDDVK